MCLGIELISSMTGFKSKNTKHSKRLKTQVILLKGKTDIFRSRQQVVTLTRRLQLLDDHMRALQRYYDDGSFGRFASQVKFCFVV